MNIYETREEFWNSLVGKSIRKRSSQNKEKSYEIKSVDETGIHYIMELGNGEVRCTIPWDSNSGLKLWEIIDEH
jgi:hypothetical protein